MSIPFILLVDIRNLLFFFTPQSFCGGFKKRSKLRVYLCYDRRSVLLILIKLIFIRISCLLFDTITGYSINKDIIKKCYLDFKNRW